MWGHLVVIIVVSLLSWSCAATVGPHGTPPPETTAVDTIPFPPYHGSKRKIQVVQINIPADDVKRYPELAEKRVGFGLSNILVETLFDTGRFVFLEEKEQILKRLVELWELSEDGIFVRDSAAATPGLQAPEFLVYAEVFDFAACSPVERIGLSGNKQTCITSVGVQVRIGNTATGEYIPGSTDPLSPQGKYVHTVRMPVFAGTNGAFDQSAVGKATLQATRYALVQALQRFDKTEW